MILSYIVIQTILLRTKRCSETNHLKHQVPGERSLYDEKRERHSVRAASRLSLKVLRFESNLCELNRL